MENINIIATLFGTLITLLLSIVAYFIKQLHTDFKRMEKDLVEVKTMALIIKTEFKSGNDLLNQKERELDIEVLNSISFDTLELTELERIIQESISDLPPKTREIFIKKRFENKKNAEIAEEMEVTLKAVEAHMTKALKILKTKLSDYLFLIFILIYNN